MHVKHLWGKCVCDEDSYDLLSHSLSTCVLLSNLPEGSICIILLPWLTFEICTWSLFSSWGNWCSEMLSNLPKDCIVTELEFKPRSVWFQSTGFSTSWNSLSFPRLISKEFTYFKQFGLHPDSITHILKLFKARKSSLNKWLLCGPEWP